MCWVGCLLVKDFISCVLNLKFYSAGVKMRA